MAEHRTRLREQLLSTLESLRASTIAVEESLRALREEDERSGRSGELVVAGSEDERAIKEEQVQESNEDSRGAPAVQSQAVSRDSPASISGTARNNGIRNIVTSNGAASASRQVRLTHKDRCPLQHDAQNQLVLKKPSNVSNADWRQAAHDEQLGMTHIYYITETDFGMLAASSCGNCLNKGRTCMVYKPAIRVAHYGQFKGFKCSGCVKDVSSCSHYRDAGRRSGDDTEEAAGLLKRSREEGDDDAEVLVKKRGASSGE